MKITSLTNSYQFKISSATPTIRNNRISFSGNDTFEKTDLNEIYKAELNRLFPNNELDNIYSKILSDFKVDYPPKLSFLTTNDEIQGGGFTFFTNSIDFDLANLIGSDYKIVGFKDGKEHQIISPFAKHPTFLNKKLAEMTFPAFEKNKIGNFDSYAIKPLTDEDKRKFVIQSLTHEIIHAQQHMIMRKTKGIGTKNIIKAWLHATPKNLIETTVLNNKVNDIYKNSPWANIPEIQTIPSSSKEGELASEWLNATQNYPPIDSQLYKTNKLETDAYNRSAKYLKDNYGGWE